jgi:hypothetical protein
MEASAPPQRVWRHPEFRRGLDDMTGTALGIAAWGLLTGIAMAKSELAMPLALLMSLIVFAGSAQLAALPLLAGGAPLWVIWATALCVNLRFVIFSAGWRRYFGTLPRAQRLRMSYFAAARDLDVGALLLGRRGAQLSGLACAVADRAAGGRPHPHRMPPALCRSAGAAGADLRHAA